MPQFRDLPIKRKLTLAIMLTCTLALLLAAVVGVAYGLSTFRRLMVRELSTVAEILGADCAIALAGNDPVRAQQELSALHQRPEILAARVYRPDGSVFAEYVRSGPGLSPLSLAQQIEGHRYERNQLILCRSIGAAGSTVGTVCLRADLSEQFQRLKTYLLIIGLVMLVCWCAALMVSIRLQQALSRPVLALAAVARDVTERKDYSLRAEKIGQDEFGRLTDNFNQMLTQIQTHDRVMRAAYGQLEASEQRFRELAENIREVFWMTNLDKTEMIYISPGYEAIWGRSCASLYAEPMNWMEAIHPDDRDRVRHAALTKQLSGDFDEEYRIVRPDKSIRWIRDRAFPIRDATGTVYRVAGIAEDTTERKRAEEALRESEERLRLAQASANVGIWDWNVQTGQLNWTEELETLYEYGPGTFPGNYASFSDRVHPDDLAQVEVRRDEAVAAHRPFDFDFRILPPSGVVKWVNCKGAANYDETGTPQRVFGVNVDITVRKRAEEQLRAAEEKYRLLVEHAPAITYAAEFGVEGRWHYISPQVETMLGYTPAEWTAEPTMWINRIHPEDRKLALAGDEEARVTGRYRREYRLLARDGHEVWCRDEGIVVPDADGRPRLLQGVIVDITQRKRTEETLRESEQRLRAIINAVPDMMFRFRADGVILDYHAHDTRELYARDQPIIGQTLQELLPAHVVAAVLHHTRLALDTGATQQFEYTLPMADGPQDFEARLVASGKDEVQAIVRNITERKRLERQLLEISDQERRRVGQDLHDSLSQQLIGTALACKTLEQKLAAKSAAESRAVAAIGKLISETIAQARSMAQGLSPVDLEADGLSSALGELAASTQKLFGVPCRFRCPQPVLVHDNTVATHLYRVAQEAVTNAIKHARPKHVWIGLSAADGRVVLSVKDDGGGIPDGRDQSHGMGLHIMAYRARMIGATLDARREPQGGTLITCSVETKQPSPASGG